MNIPRPDLLAALKVETTLALVDHEGLGVVVAELTSIEQAGFLMGLAEGFSHFDNASLGRGLQCAAIAGEFKDEPAIGRGVVELLRLLADHIEEVTA